MKQESSEHGFIDYVILLIKWKHILVPMLILVMALSYLSIYFFIDEEFESTALIIPSKSDDLGGILGAMKQLKGLPINLGGAMGNEDISLYNTILESRTFLTEIVNKFDLVNVYGFNSSDLGYFKKVLITLGNNIKTKETENGAFEITVSDTDPQRASNMTKYILDLLNNKIVNLDIIKSKNSRIFIGARLDEINARLKASEDSLNQFQERTGLLYPESQLPGIIEAYNKLEVELISKQIQKSVYENIYDKDSPILKNFNFELEEFSNKLEKIKKEGLTNSFMLGTKNLSKDALTYYRLYREVTINNSLLEFLLPLYEKAKVDEKKDLPVFQVIDDPIPAEKKSYPPRTIFTLVITFGFFILFLFAIIIKENEQWNSSKKILFIKKNIFSWKIKE